MRMRCIARTYELWGWGRSFHDSTRSGIHLLDRRRASKPCCLGLRPSHRFSVQCIPIPGPGRSMHPVSPFSRPSTYSMRSSTCKANAHLTEESLHDIDDTSVLNIRLDSLDLERAMTTLDTVRASDNRISCPYRSTGLFRFNLAPQISLPRIPRPAIFRSKTESSSKPADQDIAETLRSARHQVQRPDPVHSLGRFSDCKLGLVEELREDTGAAQRSQRSEMSGSMLTDIPILRLSDYGRGLVSVRKDFSSTSQSPSTRRPRG